MLMTAYPLDANAQQRDRGVDRRKMDEHQREELWLRVKETAAKVRVENLRRPLNAQLHVIRTVAFRLYLKEWLVKRLLKLKLR